MALSQVGLISFLKLPRWYVTGRSKEGLLIPRLASFSLYLMGWTWGALELVPLPASSADEYWTSLWTLHVLLSWSRSVFRMMASVDSDRECPEWRGPGDLDWVPIDGAGSQFSSIQSYSSCYFWDCKTLFVFFKGRMCPMNMTDELNVCVSTVNLIKLSCDPHAQRSDV